jgi:RNA polymerase sigma-70 factor (ECF subfamily)
LSLSKHRSYSSLVPKTLAGDREAFGRLYDRHAAMVRAVVAAVTGDWSAVEDMTQECFLRAYRKLATLRDRDRFGPWIAGVARHVARERRRSLRRDRHEFRDPEPAEVEPRSDIETNLHSRDQLEIVLRRLAELPEQERLAVHLFFFKEQNAERAAEVLGLSRSGFYALVQRAVARLATRIELRETKERTKR